jgi:toxin ParE1/3/4
VVILWTPKAVSDRTAIFRHIQTDNLAAAIALDLRFEQAVKRLERFPNLGRPGRIEGTRELVAHANYILIYEQQLEGLQILRLLHVAQQWPLSI